MYAYYHPAMNGLQADDVAGICSIYSDDGSRNTLMGPVAAKTCNPQPLLGFQLQCGTLDAASFVPMTSPTLGTHNEQGGDGGIPPLTENLWGCSAARAARGGLGALYAVPALASMMLLVRRRRWRAAKS
jgi:hypothetical protein